MQINQNAPVVQSKELFIQANPEKVWEVLTNINRWPAWNGKISKAHMEGTLTVGSVFHWKINGASIRSILHTVETNQKLGWSGATFGATAIHNWYLEARDGGTLVKVEESMEGWLIALFRKKMNRDLAADMTYWLEALKRES